MDTDNLVLAIIHKHSRQRQEVINEFHQEIKSNMEKAEMNEKEYNKKNQVKMMQNFCKILQKISTETAQAKSRYENADREAMRLDKLAQIASEVKFFRSQCIQTRNRIMAEKKKISSINQKNAYLRQEIKAMNIIIQQRQSCPIHKSLDLTQKESSEFLSKQKYARRSYQKAKKKDWTPLKKAYMNTFTQFFQSATKKEQQSRSFKNYTSRRAKKFKSIKFFKEDD